MQDRLNLPSGRTQVAGVTGWPIAQSKSPRMHNFWLKTLGIDGAYMPFPIKEGQFEPAVRGLQLAGLRGLNVTMPHKQAAFAIADRRSPVAEAMGAVNTLVFEDDGTIFGDNTDAFGFMENLRAGHLSFDFGAGPALVLGAGGAAKAIVHGLMDVGVPNILIANRTQSKAEALALSLDPRGKTVQVVAWHARDQACQDLNLLVNTTALGMRDKQPLEINLDHLPKRALVTDIVYVPLKTDLLVQAEGRGNPTQDGLGMLLYQAVRGFTYWFGQEPQVTDELRAIMLAD